jgi:hypothetical protein
MDSILNSSSLLILDKFDVSMDAGFDKFKEQSIEECFVRLL